MSRTTSPVSPADSPAADRPRTDDTGEPPGQRRTEEFRTFIFLTLIMAPVLAVMIVGGYCLVVWIYQTFTGPPGSGLY